MKFSVDRIDFFERPLRLRLPFRFGSATVTEASQAFVRVRIHTADKKEAEGAAAELLAPKWFDKSPELSEADGIAQLRESLHMARDAYLAGGINTAFGHSIDNYGPQIAIAALKGLNNLTASFGPALIDRALLDALGRALGQSFFAMIERNVPGIQAPGWQQDLQAFDMDEYLESLRPVKTIAVRHTVGLLDPVTAADLRAPVGDGLPETLEQVIERYGHRWFKVKLSGDVAQDVERLAAIASVLDRPGTPYQATLDGNEQFESAEAALALWRAVRADPRLMRFAAAVAYIEQPVKRLNALSGGAGSDVSELAEEKPVLIDESDDTLEAFPRARRLGYTGVSAKNCKGFYKAILNSARCRLWNREEGASRYFVSGEDLTTQAGLAVQQDLALAGLLGLAHVERNGHHYVNGMAGAPEAEQDRFLAAHGALYEKSHGAVRLKIAEGTVSLASLGCPGFAGGAMPDWDAMTEMKGP